ncbi:MAG: zinc ABC transporter solute-binding protein [Saprospiraceae bacterium]|nr:zinc ABC transporter solute-binding protein [Saprospiraceae bacterium]
MKSWLKNYNFYLILPLLFCISNGILHSQKIKVLSTASMWHDMCKVISGDLVDCDFIVPIGSDPHLYEPTPADLIKVNQANAILINGLTFEGWLTKLIENSGTKAKQIFITKGIKPIESSVYHNATDPHAWMDVENAIIYAENIYLTLTDLDPRHKDEYHFNFQLYKKELQDLNQHIINTVLTIPESKRVLITSHDGFRYFGNKYGIQLEPLQGTSTEADVQSTTLLKVNQVIKEKQIPAIFVESTINPKLIEQIQKENNIIIGGKLYADSLGDSTTLASTYIGMMRHDIDVIGSALRKSYNDIAQHSAVKNTSIYYWIIGFYLISFLLLYYINRK